MLIKSIKNMDNETILQPVLTQSELDLIIHQRDQEQKLLQAQVAHKQAQLEKSTLWVKNQILKFTMHNANQETYLKESFNEKKSIAAAKGQYILIGLNKTRTFANGDYSENIDYHYTEIHMAGHPYRIGVSSDPVSNFHIYGIPNSSIRGYKNLATCYQKIKEHINIKTQQDVRKVNESETMVAAKIMLQTLYPDAIIDVSLKNAPSWNNSRYNHGSRDYREEVIASISLSNGWKIVSRVYPDSKNSKNIVLGQISLMPPALPSLPYTQERDQILTEYVLAMIAQINSITIKK